MKHLEGVKALMEKAHPDMPITDALRELKTQVHSAKWSGPSGN